MRKLAIQELNRVTTEEFKTIPKIGVTVVLDNVRSMNNIGSVFRTSDAFLIEKICLCGITATPPNKEIHKTALGATDSVKWEYFDTTEEAIVLLKDSGYYIASVEQAEGSISLEEFQLEKDRKVAVIFGNEVKGVDQGIVNQSDCCLEIPQMGTKHSLNISVCAGIVLWELFKQRIQIKKPG